MWCGAFDDPEVRRMFFVRKRDATDMISNWGCTTYRSVSLKITRATPMMGIGVATIKYALAGGDS